MVTSGESSSWSCVSRWAHISVTAGRIFLILAMMMGYDVGLMPLSIKILILSVIPDAQTKMYVPPKNVML